MRAPHLPVCLILSILAVSSCEPWNLEKKPYHDFKPFDYSTSDNADKEVWGLISHNGGYIVVGTTEDAGSGNPDIYLLKVDEEGERKWHSSIGDSDPEEGTSIIARADGKGYSVVGNKNVGGSNWQIYLVNTDLEGIKSGIESTFGYIKEDRAFTLVQEPGGGYLLAGYSLTYEGSGFGTEAWIYQADSNGQEKPFHHFGNPLDNGNDLDDFGHCLLRAEDGDYLLLATFADRFAEGDFNLHLLKLDGSDFSEKANEILIENCHRINASIIKTESGYAVLGALTANKLALVTTGADCSKLRETSYDNCDCGKAASLNRTSDGGFLLLSSGMTLIRTDESGREIGRKDFPGETLGHSCVLQSPDDGYIFAGAFDDNGRKQLRIAKISPVLSSAQK